MIRDGLAYFGYTLDSWRTGPIIREIGRRSGQLPPPLSSVAEGAEPAYARVYRGTWIADCPAAGCAGAEAVWKTTRLLWCATCHNADIGGAWRPVLVPDDAFAIEAALMRRPVEQSRNWQLPETVDDLLRENAEHGL